jgi:thiol:disulfide interchange protein DsbA
MRRLMQGGVAMVAVLLLTGFLMERFVAGSHYQRSPAPAPGNESTVVEFFSYACPHCRALDPEFKAWKARQPAGIKVTREAAGWNPRFEALARFHYALEEMGLAETLDDKVFQAIHDEKKPLLTVEEQTAFVVANGGDGKRFAAVVAGPAVAARMAQSRDLLIRHRISGVPAMLVNGTWLTDVSMAGSPKELFAVVEFLLPRRPAP